MLSTTLPGEMCLSSQDRPAMFRILFILTSNAPAIRISNLERKQAENIFYQLKNMSIKQQQQKKVYYLETIDSGGDSSSGGASFTYI